MKTLSFFAALLLLCSNSFAQHLLQLDNGTGGYISVYPPTGLSPGSVYYLPNPPSVPQPSGFVGLGSVSGQIPIWNASTSIYVPLNPGTAGQVLSIVGGATTWAPPAVSSIFGRTGTVIAAAADYNFGQIAGTASIGQGGTGAASADGALTNLLPPQTLHPAAVLQTNGTTTLWTNFPVTSVHGRTGAIIAAVADYNFSQIAGTASIGQGGTGQTTANASLNALLPTQAVANTGMVLQSDGTNTSWQNLSVNGVNFPITNGHLQSKQTTIVTGAAQVGAGTTATINPLNGCTDVAGHITLTTSGAGLAAGDQIKISFHGSAFTVAPVVIVTPGNANTANNIPYISAVTTTDFTIAFTGAPGNGQTQDFYYHVIETQ